MLANFQHPPGAEARSFIASVLIVGRGLKAAPTWLMVSI
jgi:hypothetical protein